ncbi:hypothetical protein B0H14DRAFT_2841548 [Mycena olivaceomarginata]|nr:hypothetical protein B0H14DRAFT_2841548 [Mycena olivaceomarginata]
MSPTFLRPPALFAKGTIFEIAPRDPGVQLSLNAWQIVGIAAAVLLLLGLLAGWIYRERKSRRTQPELSAAKGEGIDRTNTADEVQLEEQEQYPPKVRGTPGPSEDVGNNALQLHMSPRQEQEQSPPKSRGTTEPSDDVGNNALQLRMSPAQEREQSPPSTRGTAEPSEDVGNNALQLHMGPGE